MRGPDVVGRGRRRRVASLLGLRHRARSRQAGRLSADHCASEGRLLSKEKVILTTSSCLERTAGVVVRPPGRPPPAPVSRSVCRDPVTAPPIPLGAARATPWDDGNTRDLPFTGGGQAGLDGRAAGCVGAPVARALPRAVRAHTPGTPLSAPGSGHSPRRWLLQPRRTAAASLICRPIRRRALTFSRGGSMPSGRGARIGGGTESGAGGSPDLPTKFTYRSRRGRRFPAAERFLSVPHVGAATSVSI